MVTQAQHEKYSRGLSRDEQMLVHLRDDLYSGSWDQMTRDLKDRLQGKPYIFKLVNRIQDDIQRIDKLQGYEKRYRIDLAFYLTRVKEKK